MSKEEIVLQNKLSRSEARCLDLEEQLRIKKQQWEEAENMYKDAEFHCRRLCEEILVRDSAETGIGKTYAYTNKVERADGSSEYFEGITGTSIALAPSDG